MKKSKFLAKLKDFVRETTRKHNVLDEALVEELCNGFMRESSALGMKPPFLKYKHYLDAQGRPLIEEIYEWEIENENR